MDAAYLLAQNIANTRFQDIPAEAIEIAKMDILDALGTTLAAGTLAPGCREVVELVKDGGGKPESTIIGFGGRAPAWMAALANSTMTHALEYDDVHAPAFVHAAVTAVPTAFAVAERVGRVPGKTLLAAVILGIDVACRLSLAAPKIRGWHQATLYGFFGGAAASGKVLGLSGDRVQHALGIAYSQAAGNRQGAADGAFTQRLQPGFAASGGVLAALLAERGITGAVNSLEGEFGLYPVYCGGKPDREALTSGLGKRFEVTNLTLRPYPSHRGTHAAVDATLELVDQHDIHPDDVESIAVFTGRAGVQALAEPVDRKRRPPTAADARSSIPYTVATVVVKRRVRLNDFTAGAIADPAVLRMAAKVNVHAHHEFEASGHHPAIVEIRTRAGNTHSKRVDVPRGSPGNPLTREHLIQKFMDCASNAASPLPEEDLRTVTEMVMDLERVDDAGAIVRLLAPGGLSPQRRGVRRGNAVGPSLRGTK